MSLPCKTKPRIGELSKRINGDAALVEQARMDGTKVTNY